MKLQKLRLVSGLLLLALIASACNIPSNVIPTLTLAPQMTEIQQTAQVLPTQTQVSLPPTSTSTQVPATSTSTPTSTPTAAPTATLPATPTSSSACTDLAKFVEDVTVPDNTEFIPGQGFIKTWRLQNVGTCTWNTQYALVFDNGEQMSGTSPLPLTGSVAPEAMVDISASLKAPGTTGTYRGDWKLQNASGTIFGLGSNAADTFYVQIKVVEGVSELNLGTATWTDNFSTTDNWFLLDTPNTKWTGGDGKLVMTSINPGGGEEWGVSDQPSMKDYYLQATFNVASACRGLDRYGLLARAPDPEKGYVFELSCDGHYRLYTWDGQNYNALQEWTNSDSIVAGSNQTNSIGIYLKGTDIRLYANGHLLAEFTDNSFDHGQFGLVIGSVNTQNFTINVTQVAYWNLIP